MDNKEPDLHERMTVKHMLLQSIEDLKKGDYKSVRVWLGGSSIRVVDALFCDSADGECVRLTLPGDGKELYARASAIVGVETDEGRTARVGFAPDRVPVSIG